MHKIIWVEAASTILLCWISLKNKVGVMQWKLQGKKKKQLQQNNLSSVWKFLQPVTW